MQRPLILSPIVLALSLHAGHAMALGFGKVSGSTALGHPLGFSVGLRLDAVDTLEPGCVSADVMVGDRPLPPELVRARLVRIGSSGERRVRVTTAVAIDEPTLSITVRAGCPAQLTRTFVVFADPPHTLARIGDPETDAADDIDPRAPPAAVPTTAPPRPAAARAPAERRDAANAPQATPAPAASLPRRARAAAPPASPARAARPVLQLDPLEDEELALPELRMSTALGTAPAASGVVAAPTDPDVIQRLLDLERLKSLETSVQQLRENERTKEQALSDLQARLHAAEMQRHANPLTYGLAALCAALALGLAGSLWLRRRDRLHAAWWAAAAEAGDPPPDAAGELTSGQTSAQTTAHSTGQATGLEAGQAGVGAGAAPQAAVSAPGALATRTRSGLEMPVSARSTAPMAPVPRPAMAALPPVDASARSESQSDLMPGEPRRPMSAEELIDLEQQVEFFVVLGQDDAAIDLLMGHVRSTSGVSPLPYLKLLEIYRRREEREPYERIRERFNRRFNAYAPEWGVDPETGFDVAGYPEVLERLQGLWQMPSMAMELLDTLLFRRDAGPTFDVPAYRELLFLYGIARDLAERDIPTSGVDLLLPLGDDDDTPSISAVVAEPDAPFGMDRLSLDLDVSTEQPPDLTIEVPPVVEPDDKDHVLDFHLDESDLPPRR